MKINDKNRRRKFLVILIYFLPSQKIIFCSARMIKELNETGSAAINNATKKDLKAIPRISRPINAARISCSTSFKMQKICTHLIKRHEIF